ncbi:transmembrane protein 56 isoform X1 [Canna indica]|uniref:Transmembrane protein 56 isoform X1 n=1 Tax=Canna indica TaxID=4628 RepID=A0AAQ3JV46_9LILI|nr:transmembrane protein 56 isoform X1 [Canna indica]
MTNMADNYSALDPWTNFPDSAWMAEAFAPGGDALTHTLQVSLSSSPTALRRQIHVAPAPDGRLSKPKRRSRAAATQPLTTYIIADPDNFREMVQRITGLQGIEFAEAAPREPAALQQICLPTLDTSAPFLAPGWAGGSVGPASLRPAVTKFPTPDLGRSLLVKDYLLADSCIPYTSLLGGILLCKMAYHFTQLISSCYFKGYNSLTKIQQIDWNNRGMSSIHAIFITMMSFYLVCFSDLFSDSSINLPVTYRSSYLSTFGLGVSVGYFVTDLAMIIWAYPSLGGMEYVFHHMLSATAVAYTMLSGEGQFYTYLVLISEITTPGINLRWFLDTAGMKSSKAYLVNGVMVFFAWMVARILLFIYLFFHVYLHFDQVMQMHIFGYLLIIVVPSALAFMNMMWFGKILRGLRKTLNKAK